MRNNGSSSTAAETKSDLELLRAPFGLDGVEDVANLLFADQECGDERQHASAVSHLRPLTWSTFDLLSVLSTLMPSCQIFTPREEYQPSPSVLYFPGHFCDSNKACSPIDSVCIPFNR